MTAMIERRDFGNTGLRVSVLGLGGSEIGFEGTDPGVVARMVAAAIDVGVNVFDTAAAYKDSEEKLGAALGAKRKDVYIFTKAGYENGFDKPADWSAVSVTRMIDRSLQRLKTDYLDLIQLHSCGKDVLAKGEAIDALDAAKKAGKARHIGYSGDGADAMFAIGTGRFETLQTSINVADQRVLADVLPAAAKRGMGVIAKRPIANAAWRYSDTPSNGYHLEYWKRLKELEYAFCKKPLEEAAAIALRFTLSQPGVCTAIVGTTKPERFASNAGAVKMGGLPPAGQNAIRARWNSVAKKEWVGQV